ncbi:MAG: 16S rRNA (cytidine(1402)-2'-O)-methyltransferase [Deltaproteobacteria bacterium]|nr:16S rRNA (cytidine(1402)-2'-O)-methyltransferase [Deltaproteobacteria bacterium]
MPLFVIATPIGNLGDLTPRAQETLAQADAVVAEDTRHSGQLLAHFGIKKPFVSLPAFDEAQRVPAIVARLVAGESLALVTDAGTPAVSDPGALLVRAAVEAGVPIVPIPGVSAVAAALSVSGFLEGRFHFAGFLPRKAQDRAEMLHELAPLRAQLVFYESPNRLHETLTELRAALGDRPALVARELTKLHEELARGTLGALAEKFSGEVLGEVVIVVSGRDSVAQAQDPAARQQSLEAEVQSRLARGERPKEIAEALALTYGKREVYQLALKLRG